MTRFNRFGLIAVLAVAAAAAPALAGSVTVGRFYTEIAKAKHMSAVDAASAEASLRGAGYRLPQLELGKDLTESDVTAISKSLGLSVTTSRPTATVSETQMNRFMSSFSQEIWASISPMPANVPKPQSVPAITRSRPTISANWHRRWAMSSGCST